MFRIETNVKSRQETPFRGVTEKRTVIITAGAKWPTGAGSDYVIPLGIPLAPVGSTGLYKAIRRATTVTSIASSDTNIYVDDADGFAVGDIIAGFTGAASITNTFLATLTAVNHTTNMLTVAALAAAAAGITTGMYVEVNENGYLLSGRTLANKGDSVYLAENVQTYDEISGTSFPVPTWGVKRGQVNVTELAANCYDPLVETELPGIDFIPATPGV